ncbi:hypothetical protein ACVWW4_003449 [Bradyrhizobium sp. LB7.1]
MLRLAEEVGLVGRHHVDEMGELGVEMIRLEQIIDILVEVGKVQRAHPLVQPPLEHQPLALRQLDADLALDQFGDGPEVAVRQMDGRILHGGHHRCLPSSGRAICTECRAVRAILNPTRSRNHWWRIGPPVKDGPIS